MSAHRRFAALLLTCVLSGIGVLPTAHADPPGEHKGGADLIDAGALGLNPWLVDVTLPMSLGVQIIGRADFAMRSQLSFSYRFVLDDPNWGIDTGLLIELPLLHLPSDIGALALRAGIDARLTRGVELGLGGILGVGLRFFDSAIFDAGNQVDLRAGARVDVRFMLSSERAEPRVFIGLNVLYLVNVLGPELQDVTAGLTLGFTQPASR